MRCSIIYNDDPFATGGLIVTSSILSSEHCHWQSSLHLLAFNILPHPAKTNNPADLAGDPGEHGGLQSSSANAFNAKPPYIPSKEIAEGLEKPKTREEVSSLI